MKHSLAALVLLLSLQFNVFSQVSRVYTPDDGLLSTQINSLYQSSDGYLWVGTQAGLSRFDGVTFETFPCENVLSIIEDERGRMWTGTATGVQLFNPSDGTFTRLDVDPVNFANLTLFVSQVMEAPGGDAVVVGTSAGGIYVVDLSSMETDDDKRALLMANLRLAPYNRMFFDKAGNLWASYESGGLSVVNYETGKPLTDNLWDSSIDFDPDKVIVNTFVEDPFNGNILMGTFRHGILVYDASLGKIRQSKSPQGRSSDISSLIYNRLFGPADGRLFIAGNSYEGIMVYNAEDETLQRGTIPNVIHDTDNWKVTTMLEDNQGNVWAGGYQNGLLCIPKSTYGFNRHLFSQRGFKGENSAAITAVYEDSSDGTLWVGTDGAGLFSVNYNGTTNNFNPTNSALGSNTIMCVTLDRSRTLWVGTYRGGLYTYTPSRGFVQFNDDRIPESIKAFAYDSQRDWLYVGSSGGGLFIIDAAQKKILSNIVEEENRWVSALDIAHDGQLWMGTYNGPMSYDPTSGTMFRYTVSEDDQASRIYAIKEAPDGTIWLGTGRGVASFDKRTGKSHFYTKQDGLSDDIIKGIAFSEDYVWISTSNGLSRLEPSTGKFDCFYAYDGIQGNEFHTGAQFKASDGRLFFGGTGGLTVFSPATTDRPQSPVPPLHFTTLSAAGNIADIRDGDTIELQSDCEMFTVGFSVAELTNPDKIVYAYKLDGFDSDWRHCDARTRSAIYTNVKHGSYTLNVKAYMAGNEQEFSQNSIKVHIAAPWYLKWWAFLIYLTILATLASGLAMLAKKKKEDAEKREEEAIKELRLSMFTNFTHEIRTPLTLVMGPLKKMREEETNPRQKDTYNLMYRNCLRINRIVNQLMDIRKVDEGQMKLHFLKTDVIYFIKDIMQSFDDLAEAGNITFSLTSDNPGENLWIDQGNFDKIIFNILSNAFKHTPAGGRVEVNVSKPVDGKVDIGIFNSGSSIAEKNLEKIFDRFFQANPMDMSAGSGVGLNLTKMLVDLHHGTVTARNEQDGVRFIVSLPTGNQHLTREELSTTTHHKDLYTRSSSADEVSVAPAASSTDTRNLKTKKTLVVVEDDLEALDYLRRELGTKYNVKVSTNGAQAWKIISSTLPDAVVTDIIMPEMDGLELCTKIRRNPSTNHIPVIIITSESDQETEKRCNEAGADRFFAKPLAMDLVESGIAGSIASRMTMKGKFGNEANIDYDEVKVPFDYGNIYNKVVDIIRANIDNADFSVEDISAELGMSRVHLNRKLKESGCLPPSVLMKSIRLKQAAYLLINNNVNVSEVAYMVGFSSHSYFSRAFHDYFGCTPKEFIEKYQKDPQNEELRRLLE